MAGPVSLAALALAGGGPAHGDQWAAPRASEVFAPSRESFVRVAPGKGTGAIVGRELLFETETGAYQYCEPRDGTRRCRSANEPWQWRGYVDPRPRP